MSKITRRSYKRKKIIMGAGLFGAIGLVSTGFAAWVLSAPATTEKTANLSVGVISDKNMEFTNIISYKTGDNTKTADDTFHFEPKNDDNKGRVRYDGENAESLSLTVSGSLSHVQNLGQITAEITAVSGEAGLDSAITKGYIVKPESYKATSTIVLWKDGADVSDLFDSDIQTDAQGEETMTFTYEVKFAWGAFFETKNPGVYFDETTAGKAYETGSPEVLEVPANPTEPEGAKVPTVAGILKDLHDLLDNIQLKLTLTADPNN